MFHKADANGGTARYYLAFDYYNKRLGVVYSVRNGPNLSEEFLEIRDFIDRFDAEAVSKLYETLDNMLI